MTDEEAKAQWLKLCDAVTDQMKEYTRPYVTMLVSPPGETPQIGTGTFIAHDGHGVLTCHHVAQFDPTALFIDDTGTIELSPDDWRGEAKFDVAHARINDSEWLKGQNRVGLLPMTKFADRFSAVEFELFFFRGIAGENARFLGAAGSDVTLSGYCSQEERGTGDEQIFEMLWRPDTATVTTGTDDEARAVIKQEKPQGFSGSLVWNTRFVELGCNLATWTPEDAVVVGMLRHYDENTNTLLAWRVEHIRAWLASENETAKDPAT